MARSAAAQQQMSTVAQGLVRRPRRRRSTSRRPWSPRADRVLNVIGQLRQQGTTVPLEQLLEKALAAADRVYALVQGQIVLEDRPASEPAATDRARLSGHDVKVDVA